MTKRILTAIALMAPVIALVLWAPAWLFLAGLLPFGLLAMWEYLELATRAGAAPARWAAYLAALVVWFVSFWDSANLLAVVVAGALALLLATLVRRPAMAEVFSAAAASVFGLLYVAVPFALVLDLRAQRDGAWVLLYTLILIWVGDTAAYFGGRAFGKRRLAPVISPGKTVEGTMASLFASVAIGHFLYSQWFGEDVHSVVFPVVLNVAAQMGDLAESALKRSAGVKDSSAILPGHGGMLDRIDSLLFAFPVAWYYWGLFAQGGF